MRSAPPVTRSTSRPRCRRRIACGRRQSGTPIGDVFPYDYIVASAEESLRNLKLETIDLLQLHVWTDEWVERDEWRRAFEDLKRSGKVQSVGVSATEHDPDSALAIMRTGLIDAVQVIYNIFDQTPEAHMLPLAQEMNIGILARVPLDEGALSGTITESTTFPAGDFREYYFRGADRKKQVVRARRRAAPGSWRRGQPARHRAPLLPVAPGRFHASSRACVRGAMWNRTPPSPTWARCRPRRWPCSSATPGIVTSITSQLH